VYDVAGSELRVSPIPSTQPSEHTVVGFAVEDADAVMLALARHGVTAVRHGKFQHEPNGIWIAADGTGVGWFRDPDGNLTSVVLWPRAKPR
jgi:hypothetical protein